MWVLVRCDECDKPMMYGDENGFIGGRIICPSCMESMLVDGIIKLKELDEEARIEVTISDY
jgi:hypothetical protein